MVKAYYSHESRLHSAGIIDRSVELMCWVVLLVLRSFSIAVESLYEPKNNNTMPYTYEGLKLKKRTRKHKPIVVLDLDQTLIDAANPKYYAKINS